MSASVVVDMGSELDSLETSEEDVSDETELVSLDASLLSELLESWLEDEASEDASDEELSSLEDESDAALLDVSLDELSSLDELEPSDELASVDELSPLDASELLELDTELELLDEQGPKVSPCPRWAGTAEMLIVMVVVPL